ncbi:MAG: hypothetical protein KGL53_08285 [Elusimicrobia bacterium]|nr:hypothetical protein [Elusimicrobiota bacterium]
MSKAMTTTRRAHGRAAEPAARLVECFDWPGEREPQALAVLMHDLERTGVRLRALWAYDSTRGGARLAAVPEEPARLREALEARRAEPRTAWCFLVEGGAGSGGAAAALRALAEAGVAIERADVLGGALALWVAPGDIPRARDVLEGRGRKR